MILVKIDGTTGLFRDINIYLGNVYTLLVLRQGIQVKAYFYDEGILTIENTLCWL